MTEASALPSGDGGAGVRVDDDAHAMRLALAQARRAAAFGEVPVGAVILDAHGNLIGSGCNQTISRNDPSGHAEIMALRDAGQRIANYRLPGARLFVTLEPCVMCMGAILHARLAQVIYGATDPKTGACESVVSIPDIGQINHHTRVTGGLLADECSAVLQDFFREKRKRGTRRTEPH